MRKRRRVTDETKLFDTPEPVVEGSGGATSSGGVASAADAAASSSRPVNAAAFFAAEDSLSTDSFDMENLFSSPKAKKQKNKDKKRRTRKLKRRNVAIKKTKKENDVSQTSFTREDSDTAQRTKSTSPDGSGKG